MTLLRPTRLPRTLVAGLLCLPLSTASILAQAPPRQPLRLDSWLGTPDWLKVSGEHRTRIESLNGQFRAAPGLPDTEDQLANRSILRVDYARGPWRATLEGLDGRMFGTDANSFADTTTVNTLDLLQANVGYAFGDGHLLTFGRYTMDIGSRRLSARNVYRNTINSFNGARWDYADESGDYQAGAFFGLPTVRRPSDRTMLVDNEHDWDEQSEHFQFFGAHAQQRIDAGSTGQVYVLGKHDTRGARDDLVLTAGFRYFRPAQRGRVSGEVEAAYQFGDRGDQDIAAYFGHASVGYTCDCAFEPSVRAAIDYATGDDNGGDYNRFDTLFGARRFEYGPTGIYGAIGRRNIVSPELRVAVRPTTTTWVLVAWRDIRLESGDDDWVEARDGSGVGKHVGSQVECRLRWEPCKRNLRFETGAAYLAGGRFRETSTSGRRTDTRYFFFETIFWF